MTTLARIAGLLLLILVGYHYINRPLGFSVAGSIATGIFAVCLLQVYRGYLPDARNLGGWAMILIGCILLSASSSFSVLLILPFILILLGYRVAELPAEFPRGGGDAGGATFGDSGGGGDCGGGE